MPSDKEFQMEDITSQQITNARNNVPQLFPLQTLTCSMLTFTGFMSGDTMSLGKSPGQLWSSECAIIIHTQKLLTTTPEGCLQI